MKTRTSSFSAVLPALAWIAVLGCLAGCREPAALSPDVSIRAASADTTHLEIGFPEAVDPVAMSDPANYEVEMPLHGGRPPLRFAVHRAAVVDTLRGRCVRLETDSIPDGVTILVRMRAIRLLTGPTLGNDVAVRMITGLNWGKDIAPLFASACNSCHAGSSPAGEYATDSYFAVWGNGVAPPANLAPGDPNCLVAVKCAPGASMFGKAGLEFIDASMIRNWIVTYQARP